MKYKEEPMTLRSLSVMVVIVLAIAGTVTIISYALIAVVVVVLGSFVVEWILRHWDISMHEWAALYADDIVTHLNAELSKLPSGDEATRLQVLRRHILDALLYAVSV